jgi:uncharacterized surface protein with fasciclin (FAS1) repeats
LIQMFRALLVAVIAAVAFGFAPMGRFASRSSLSMANPSQKAVMPSAPKDVKTGKNIAESVKGSAAHTTLAAALAAANLNGALSGEAKLCLFAPTDAAFAKLPAGTVDALLKDIPKLTNILKYHVSANQQRPTRNGRQYDSLCLNEDGSAKEVAVQVTVDTCLNYILSANERAECTSTVECTNGYIHVIDGVLLPYEGKQAPFGPGSEKKDAGMASYNANPGASGEDRYTKGGK